MKTPARTHLAFSDARAHHLVRQLRDAVDGDTPRAQVVQIHRLRIALTDQLADYELAAEAAGLSCPARRWMRRALTDATVDALPMLVRIIAQELALTREIRSSAH